LIYHANHVFPSALSGVFERCWLGVDIFFVLSGFLITGILWRERGSEGYFKRFYGRRVLRIWPAYLLLLVFAFALLPLTKRMIGGPLQEIPGEQLGIWPYLLMIQNCFPRSLALSAVLAVTWSLAIEEQFYLIWPAFIYKTSRRFLAPILGALFLAAPLIRSLLMSRGVSQLAIYYNPLTHGDSLILGALIAILLRTGRYTRRFVLHSGLTLFLTSLGLFILLHPTKITSVYCSPFIFTIVALLGGGFLLIALVSQDLGYFFHEVVFKSPVLSFLGFISYSLYLFHYFIFHLGVSDKLMSILNKWHHPGFTRALMMIVATGLSIVLSYISRITIERHALSFKRLFDHVPKSS